MKNVPSFDYAAAHEDLVAGPMAAMFDAHPEVAQAYEHVTCGQYEQGPDLDVQPTHYVLMVTSGLSDETLARAAQLLYAWGHWSSRHSRGGDDSGCTWKLASMLDVILSKRMRLPRARQDFSKCELRLTAGVLRLYMTGSGRDDFSTWVECGPATRQVLKLVDQREIPGESMPIQKILGGTVSWELAERVTKQVEELRRLYCETHAPKFLELMLSWKKYTRPESEHRHACDECGKLPIFDNPRTDHEYTCPLHPDVVDPARTVRSSVLKDWAARVDAVAPLVSEELRRLATDIQGTDSGVSL